MITKESMTVHCWLPNLNIIALGIGAGGVLIGTLLAPLLSAAYWSLEGAVLLGTVLLGVGLLTFALSYCRVQVSPWEVQVLGSGLRKGRYNCLLEEVVLGGQWRLDGHWGLGQPATYADYQNAALSFSLEEDWDTGTPYLRIQHRGEEVLNLFRAEHYAEIQDAFAIVRARRHLLDAQTAKPDFPAHA